MSNIRFFRIYDLLFLLSKKIRFYSLNNLLTDKKQLLSLQQVSESITLNPASLTAVLDPGPNGFIWAGQVDLDRSNFTAWFAWLCACDDADINTLEEMIDFFTEKAGAAGMKSIAATVKENCWFLNSFRRRAFGVCARQTRMRVTASHDETNLSDITWYPVSAKSFDATDAFFQAHTPPIYRQYEHSLKGQRYYGCRRGEEVLARCKAFTDADHISIEPVFHPAIEHPSQLLQSLIGELNSARTAHIQLIIPDFQSWIIPDLEEAGFVTECRQVLLRKNISVAVKEEYHVKERAHAPAIGMGIQQTNTKNED